MKFTTRQKEFKSNLQKAVYELVDENTLLDEIGFKISLIDEPNKNHNSIDDLMRLGLHTNIDLKNRVWKIDEVIGTLTAPSDKFPLWIEVHLLDKKLIELRSSKRFRKFRELQNQEQGYPPFQIKSIDS